MSRERMSSADAAWLQMDRPTRPMVVNAVLWFDEPLDWALVSEVLRWRLVLAFPRFRQRVVESSVPGAGPWWEDDPRFELEYHVHRVALPAPGAKRELERFIADTLTIPLDRSRALWRVYLIDDYESGCALLFRAHHCIADGLALAQVMLSLADEGPDSNIAAARVGGQGDGAIERLTHGATAALSGAGSAIAAIRRGPLEALARGSQRDLAALRGRDVEALAKLMLLGRDPHTPLKSRLGSTRRVGWSSPLSLAEVRSVGRPFEATVNDVLLAALTGALRSYLKRCGSRVDELRAIVPYNLRPLDEPLPRELGNRFGLVFAPLPVGIDSRRERLIEVKRQMDAIKHSREAAVSWGLLSALGLSPAWIERILIDEFAAKGSAVVTNVPGPLDRVLFAGAPVGGVVVWAPYSGKVGMSVSLFSYAGDVTLGLAVDADVIAEPQEIVDSFAAEFRALAGIARTPRSPTGASGRRRVVSGRDTASSPAPPAS